MVPVTQVIQTYMETSLQANRFLLIAHTIRKIQFSHKIIKKFYFKAGILNKTENIYYVS